MNPLEWAQDLEDVEIESVVDTRCKDLHLPCNLLNWNEKLYYKMRQDTCSSNSLLRIDPSALSYSQGGRIIGYRIRARGFRLVHYTFRGDDKFFLVNDKGVLFSDSLLYRSFYDTLPYFGAMPQYALQDSSGIAICMSRQQYGHFLFDDLLPFIAGLKVFSFDMLPREILILISREWQRLLAEDLLLLTGITTPRRYMELQTESCLYTIGLAEIFIPIFPDIFWSWKELVASSQYMHLMTKRDKKIYDLAYLSRDGFDTESRVSNVLEFRSNLIGSGKNVLIIRPHEQDLLSVIEEMLKCKSVIAEPGTTPLIAMIIASWIDQIIVLQSARTVTHCEKKYFYSGWRYHLAFSDRIQYCLGEAVKPMQNPFSDIASYQVLF